jgi:hypothetical protein
VHLAAGQYGLYRADTAMTVSTRALLIEAAIEVGILKRSIQEEIKTCSNERITAIEDMLMAELIRPIWQEKLKRRHWERVERDRQEMKAITDNWKDKQEYIEEMSLGGKRYKET